MLDLNKNCVNCGACYNICPVDAISIETNNLFYEISIDNEKCINCGQCNNKCPDCTQTDSLKPLTAYGAWNKSADVLDNSSSGGVFYELARLVLNRDGVVFGAAFDQSYRNVAFLSTNAVPLEKLMKSKYVESSVEYIFREVKQNLDKGIYVLFAGTPCQIYGLLNFLNKDYDNLITCDFTCGGLPSHHLYQSYIDIMEKRYKSKVSKCDFRPKTHGWQRYAISINFENDRNYNKLAMLDEYYAPFLYGGYSIRDNCLTCSFNEKHAADVTLADFWMYRSLSELSNQNGVSLVLCNSTKGQSIWDEIEEHFWVEKLNIKDASYNLRGRNMSESERNKRKKFLCDYEKFGLVEAYKRNFKMSKIKRIKVLLANYIHRKR